MSFCVIKTDAKINETHTQAVIEKPNKTLTKKYLYDDSDEHSKNLLVTLNLLFINNEKKNLENNQYDLNAKFSLDERIKIFNESLKDFKVKKLNIPFIAYHTADLSHTNLEKLIEIMKKSATEHIMTINICKDISISIQNTRPIDTKRCLLALDEILEGPEKVYSISPNNENRIAIHEAGHAASLINKKKFILTFASIVNRAKNIGRVHCKIEDHLEPFTIDEYKELIVFILSGGASEQLFGFEKSWDADQNNYLIPKNTITNEGLIDLSERQNCGPDMIEAYQRSYHLAIYILTSPSSDQHKENPNDIEIENKAFEILNECYQKAIEVIEDRKDEITKMANVLIQKKIISGDEIYRLFNTNRPLYAFEIDN
ncbi:MAG: hypothetical protein JO129_03520 [Candidatus Dependentiae bacterium]|nr:hypothetical protein [Candidatus Dependentiae bacterium]